MSIKTKCGFVKSLKSTRLPKVWQGLMWDVAIWSSISKPH